MNFENNIILFVKYPEPGRVKTRLAAAIGEELACELYKNFVQDLLQTLKKVNASSSIAFSPEESRNKVFTWLGKEYCYIPQRGADLGQRLRNAFSQGFLQGYRKVIIVGSDSPDLPSVLLETAFAALQTSEAVIGPAADGGYYLIGFKEKILPSGIFHDIHWSSDVVFAETLRILQEQGYKTCILPQWSDVDTLADLQELCKRNKSSEFCRSATVRFLELHAKDFRLKSDGNEQIRL